MEALALPSLGMPSNAFSLVFGAGKEQTQATAVFQTVISEFIWHAAIQRSFPKARCNLTCAVVTRNAIIRYNGLPDVMDDIINGRSLIKTDFPIDRPRDIDSIIQENQGRAGYSGYETMLESVFPAFRPEALYHRGTSCCYRTLLVMVSSTTSHSADKSPSPLDLASQES